MLTVGSLFSGIGGFDLGLERSGGFRTAWFCERDEFCRRVLAKHWPAVPTYDDVCAMHGADVAPVDVLCGGFPCQDISAAGAAAGIDDGARSGLWREYARLVRELRPRYVLVENVPGRHPRQWLGRVLGDLAALGYDAEWESLRASDFDAPHERERVWVVAYPASEQRWPGLRGAGQGARRRDESADSRRIVFPDADGGAVLARWLRGRAGEAGGPERWAIEPDVGRVAYGVPDRLDRMAALGNALVPIAAEWIGHRILVREGLTG